MDVVLISPVSPLDARDGHRLAILSDVTACIDNHLDIGLIAFTYDYERLGSYAAPYQTALIPVGSGGFVSRLFRGLVKGLVPSLERFYTAHAEAAVRDALKRWMPSTVIIDDCSVAGYIPLVRTVVPGAKVILRSHNVMHDVRVEQLRRTSGFLRLPVQVDCTRYCAFERQAVTTCDEHWSITPADAERMADLYLRPCGYLSVSLPLDRYTWLDINAGRKNRFSHVGTIDFRRRSDLEVFLSQSWPHILAADSQASLTLAGKVYGAVINATNVEYRGQVASDTDVYREGRFALNFQNSTGGVKLKTLTSLAAGRTLISTPHGVEGIPILSGRHYWDIATLLSKCGITHLLRDDTASRGVAEAGRHYVMSAHSRTVIARQLYGLLSAK